MSGIPANGDVPEGGGGAGDVHVKNSSGSYDVTVAAGSTLTTPNVTIIDGDNNPHVIPSNENYMVPPCTPQQSVTIRNSDNSKVIVIPAGTLDYTVPDVIILDGQGIPHVVPAMDDYAVPLCTN